MRYNCELAVENGIKTSTYSPKGKNELSLESLFIMRTKTYPVFYDSINLSIVKKPDRESALKGQYAPFK